MKFDVSAELPMNCEAYWKARNSPAFLELLGTTVGKWRIVRVSEKVKGGVVRFHQRTVPTTPLPLVLKIYMGDSELQFDDVLTYDKPGSGVPCVAEVVTTTTLLSRTDIRGTLSCEPRGPHRCVQRFRGDVKVALLGLGGIVERIIVSEMMRSYTMIPGITARYLAQEEKDAGPASVFNVLFGGAEDEDGEERIERRRAEDAARGS